MKRILQNDYAVITLLGIVHGILAVLSLAPFNYPLIAWLAPWPLFYLAERFHRSFPKLLLSGASAAFFLCAFAFYWVIQTMVVFGGMSVIVAGFIFPAYAFFLNLKMPAFVILMGKLLRGKRRRFMPPS